MRGHNEPGPAIQPPKSDRLVALFLFGTFSFSPPLLRVFGVPATVFGWPLLTVYVFALWAVLIALLALHVEGRGTPRPTAGRR